MNANSDAPQRGSLPDAAHTAFRQYLLFRALSLAAATLTLVAVVFVFVLKDSLVGISASAGAAVVFFAAFQILYWRRRSSFALWTSISAGSRQKQTDGYNSLK